jgi:hypothetical protein
LPGLKEKAGSGAGLCSAIGSVDDLGGNSNDIVDCRFGRGPTSTFEGAESLLSEGRFRANDIDAVNHTSSLRNMTERGSIDLFTKLIK